MVFSAPKPNNNNNNNNNNEGWGMGLLFIFFHNHPHHLNNNNKRPTFSLSSPNLLLSKTQSTLSICALLVFTTLLVFTLSTFEPATNRSNNSVSTTPSRRLLHEQKGFSISGHIGPHAALQGMGKLYLRGSKAMSDLIVGHVSENVSATEFRSFLRLIVHSGLLSRSDVVFLFSTPTMAAKFAPLVFSECDSFHRLVQLGVAAELGPGLNRYRRLVGEEEKEPLWGKRRGNSSSEFDESNRSSYGSVLGFDSSELDPEDSLSGFLDHVPMSLRRWACYPMLLGRVRRNFKHMMLVDVKGSLILSDPFSRVSNRSSETVIIWSNSGPDSAELTRHGKRKLIKAHSQDGETHCPVYPGIIIGGSRGVRRFANAALTEIVRVTIEHKGKNRNSATDSGIVNQLVQSGHLLKNINLITATESIPYSGALGGFNSDDSGSSFLKLSEYFSVVKRGQNGKFDVEDALVMREICMSHKLYAAVYNDCGNYS